MHRFVLALVVLVCVAGCASVRDLVPGLLGGSASDLAEQVVIQRDAAGTPHVVGQSDAAAVFGLAYALAEDDFAAIDAAVLDALGRSAERLGAAGVADDVVRRAFQVSAYARAEYAAEPAERQALWDAWAAGLNRYLADHPGTPAYVGRFEPWHLFAVSRPVDAELVVDGVPVRDVVALALGAEAPDGAGPADGTANAAEGEAGLRSTGEAGLGTAGEDGLRTAWALAPERTADAGTLLLARRTPAGPDAGPVWDASVRSASGLSLIHI